MKSGIISTPPEDFIICFTVSTLYEAIDSKDTLLHLTIYYIFIFIIAKNYSGGEYRSRDTFGYGLYQVNMKPAKNPGIVSSFFTYTGPTDGTPWDEIDIEFLGKDTTKVQFNYYTNGQGNHEYLYDLGFDASQSYHTYAIDWKPNYIAWRVDGKEVYRTYKDIPSHPGKIMMNLWPGINVDSWLDPYNGKTPLNASYDWVAYDPV